MTSRETRAGTPSTRIVTISFETDDQTFNDHLPAVKFCRGTFALCFRNFPQVLKKAKNANQYAM
jgi:hypothetical protein